MSDDELPESIATSARGFVGLVEGWQKFASDNWRTLTKPPILATVLLFAIGGYWLGYSKRSDITDVLREKSDFLSREVDAYKDRLQGASPDEAAKQIAELKKKLSADEDNIRILLPEKKRLLEDKSKGILDSNVDNLKKDISVLFVFAFGVGDSSFFATKLYEYFKGKNINVSGIFNSACDSDERGVLVGVTNIENPSDRAKDFLRILEDAGLKPHFSKWFGSGLPLLNQDFDLFICPESPDFQTPMVPSSPDK